MFEIINLIVIFSRMIEFPKYFLHFFHRRVRRAEKRNISSERYQIQRWLSKNAMIYVPFNLEKRGTILFRDEITVPLFIIGKTLEGYKAREKFCRIVLIRSFGERITRYVCLKRSVDFFFRLKLNAKKNREETNERKRKSIR